MFGRFNYFDYCYRPVRSLFYVAITYVWSFSPTVPRISSFGRSMYYLTRRFIFHCFELAKCLYIAVRDWVAVLFSPVNTLRRLSSSLFGPTGKLAIYERRRFERLAFAGSLALRLAI